MMNLIHLELFKLRKKKISWVVPLIVLILSILYLAAIRNFSMEVPDSGSFLASLMGLPTLMNLGIVVIASGMVSAEFSKGTVKFLLIRPYTRSQILLAKFIVMIIYSLVFSVLLFAATLALTNIFLQPQSPMVQIETYQQPALIAALTQLGLNFFLILFYLAIVFLLQTLTRSQALAVGFGVAFLFGSSVLSMINMLIMTKYPWFKWNPLNFLQIKDSVMEGYAEAMKHYSVGVDKVANLYVSTWQMALGLVLSSLVVYLLANLIFKKRDVTLT